MTSNTINTSTNSDFLKLSISKCNKDRRLAEKSTQTTYNKSKEKLDIIWYLKPSPNHFVKYLRLMYDSLSKKKAFLSEKEIVAKIASDTASLEISEAKIRQLLLLCEAM